MKYLVLTLKENLECKLSFEFSEEQTGQCSSLNLSRRKTFFILYLVLWYLFFLALLFHPIQFSRGNSGDEY